MRIQAKDPRLISLMGEFMRAYLPGVRMLDGELRETQTTDYFSKHRRSDCAVRELTAR